MDQSPKQCNSLGDEEDASLTLSLTPPILDEQQPPSEGTNSISEHLSSGTSVENDRSLHEIEVGRSLFPGDDGQDVVHISQEDKPLNYSNSSWKNSGFTEMDDEGQWQVEGILQEILADKQFVSEHSGEEMESLDIFANVDLDDKSLTNYRSHEKGMFGKKTQSCELDSFRENSNSVSMVSTTEYKQLQEDCNNKLMECNSIIICKNELIQQLSDSLNQSVTERNELLMQIKQFKEEIVDLQMENRSKFLQEQSESGGGDATASRSKSLENSINIPMLNLDSEYTTIEETMSLSQLSLLNEMKIKINDFVMQKIADNKTNCNRELQQLKEQMSVEKQEYERETKHLRDLLANIKCGSTEIMDLKNELEAKHSREMEDLRRYFEKKCADLEKNYSEEVFSQQSRKISESSCSEADLSVDALLPDQQSPQKNVKKFKQDLIAFVGKLNLRDIEQSSDEELLKIHSELIGTVNSELVEDLQRKHEFDIETYENKIRELEERHQEELDVLSSQLKQVALQNCNVSSSVQEVGTSSDEFEINEVVQSYERRLNEQVTLAKIDFINNLSDKIQRFSSNDNDGDEDCPSELFELRDRFAAKYKQQIEQLQEQHETEIANLREEHLKVLNGALDRARRRSLRETDNLSKGEQELIKERDSLKKQTVSLRHFLAELLKYFTQCEDELNNTLVDELLRQGFDKTIDDDLNDSTTSSSNSGAKRVHLTPNFAELINLLDHSSLDSSDSKDISLDLKNGLEMCLEKLKQDANAILALTSNLKVPPQSAPESSIEEKLSFMTRKLITETQLREKVNEELQEALSLVKILEKEKDLLEGQLDEVILRVNVLEDELKGARSKIGELIESGHKEIVSEGYGDGQVELQSLNDTMKVLSDLQDSARSMLGQSRASADPNLLNLIEELCRVGEKVKEEARKERLELLQQQVDKPTRVSTENCVDTSSSKKIDVADKKYKKTMEFLEEQANEREIERDEAQRKINQLNDVLKDRDRDRASHEMVISEDGRSKIGGWSMELFIRKHVEQLEAQLQEMTKVLQEKTERAVDVEVERNEAVDKIKVLREIIRELEAQREVQAKEVEDCLTTIQQLQCIVEQQSRAIEDFKDLDDSNRSVSDAHELRRHIHGLEKELQQLRVASELAGSEGVLKQLSLQLFELEISFEKKTKVLETLHQSQTTCSSPSEEMSIKDVLRPQTPSAMVLDECEVPLQQLARLKEKLIRHSRAEEAAVKRIRDLEMQVFNLKAEQEASQNEKDYLRKQIQEQLVLISDLQIRLDEQRMRAEYIEKQTNTSLESRIYDLQSEIAIQQETNQTKEKTIANLNQIIHETQKRLKDVEKEFSQRKDDELIVAMQEELEKLRQDNQELNERISKNRLIPNLVDNIISDKNIDIGKLQDKLQQTEDKLCEYTSLNLTNDELQSLYSLKKSGNSILDALSLLDLSEPDKMRRMDSEHVSLLELNVPFKRNVNETVFLGGDELSTIEKIGPTHANYTMQTPLGKPNSTEVEKRVHFEDTSLHDLHHEMSILRAEIETKDSVIKDLEKKLSLLNELEKKIEKMHQSLEQTEEALSKATETFEKEQEELLGLNKDLQTESSEKSKRLAVLEEDFNRKAQMCLSLAKEKKEALKELEQIKSSNDNTDKDKRILKLENDLLKKSFEIEELKTQIDDLEQNSDRFKDELKSKRDKLSELDEKVKIQEGLLKKLEEDNKSQKVVIVDRECEIEILKEDAERYQEDLSKLEKELENLNRKTELKDLQKNFEDSNKKNYELNKEVNQLQELVSEKDKIIAQLTEDSHQLHLNLMAINSKLNETGNIVDLAKKLREEQKKTTDLLEEIHNLKSQVMELEAQKQFEGVDEIAGQLKREIEFAAEIDANIISAVSDQSLSAISETQDMEIFKKIIKKERSSNKKLIDERKQLQQLLVQSEEKLNAHNNLIAELQSRLDSEKFTLQQTQLEDAKLLEQMRLQLDAALDKEEQFGKLLESEKTVRKTLESELETLKIRTTNLSSNSKTDTTEYKPPPTTEQFELLENRKKLQELREENLRLTKKLKTVKSEQTQLENNVKYSKQMLQLEEDRCKSLVDKVEKMMVEERELREVLMRQKMEVEDKVRIIERKQVAIDDLTQDKAHLVKQKQQLVEVVKGLEASGVQTKRFHDKHNVPYTDIIARNDFLFAQTLQLESVNKALIWQKRYLMSYLHSHQQHCLIEALPHTRIVSRRSRKSARYRFRSAVFVLISITRMKYLVTRWNTEPRLASKINARHYRNYHPIPATPSTAHFQIGQPVSHQNFVPSNINFVTTNVGTSERVWSPIAGTSRQQAPWSGASPPSKESRRQHLKIGSQVVSNKDLNPLRAPQLLAQFVERFESMHEKLGVVIDNSNI